MRPKARDRKLLALLAGGCCEYCRSPERFSPASFSLEHVISQAQGGTGTVENLAFSCQGCNNHKYTSTMAIDPLSGDVVPLFHPRQQRWADHFVWNEDFGLIIGLTPTGRATIQKLRLNREGVHNLRRSLRVIREHPPENLA